MKFNLLMLATILLIGCQESETGESNNNEISIEEIDTIQQQIAETYSHEFIEQLGSYDEIPTELAEIFLRPALEEQYHYRYSKHPNFLYEFGDLVYENDTFFVCTFSLDGDDGTNMLNAEFIASFNKHTDTFIDSRLIGSNSDFEGHGSIGYNTSTTISHVISRVENDNLIVLVECDLKDVFYNFNSQTSNKPEDTEEIQVSTFEVHVETNGEMFDTLEE